MPLMRIKNIVAAALGLFVLVSLGVAVKGLYAPRAAAPPIEKNIPHQVLVFCFHSRERCEACLKFERYTRAALESAFADELKNGLLEFRVLNRQEPANEYYVHEYKLFTQAVIMADYHAGQQTAWKDLRRIWELLDDQPKFTQYIQAEARLYLEAKP